MEVNRKRRGGILVQENMPRKCKFPNWSWFPVLQQEYDFVLQWKTWKLRERILPAHGEVQSLVNIQDLASRTSTTEVTKTIDREREITTAFLISRKYMEMLAGIEQQRKKRKLQDCCINNNTSCSSLTSLPTEILIDILLRLPVSSLFCIRCVSKTVLNIVDRPPFVTLHTQRLLTVQATQNNFDDVNHDQVPKLMHIDHSTTTAGYCAFQSVEYDDNKNAFTHKEDDATTPPEFGPPPPRPDGWYDKFEFVFCNLLCYRFFGNSKSDTIRFEEPCILVNPLRREVLVLPTTTNAQLPASCPKDSVLDWLAMGLDNVTNHLKIVRVSGNKDYSSQLWPKFMYWEQTRGGRQTQFLLVI